MTDPVITHQQQQTTTTNENSSNNNKDNLVDDLYTATATVAEQVDVDPIEAIAVALRTASNQLEIIRCHETELEAWTIFASSQIKYFGSSTSSSSRQQQSHNNTNNNNNSVVVVPLSDPTTTDGTPTLPSGVNNAWKVLEESIKRTAVVATDDGGGAVPSIATSKNVGLSSTEVKIPTGGSIHKAIITNCIGRSIKEMSQKAATVTNHHNGTSESSLKLKRSYDTLQSFKQSNLSTYATTWLSLFDQRLYEIQSYHTQHGTNEELVLNTMNGISNNNPLLLKRPKLLGGDVNGSTNNPVADGYDIASSVTQWTDQLLYNDQTIISSSTTPLDTDGTSSSSNPQQPKDVSTSSTTEVSGTYRTEEIFGKYIDLQPNYEYFVHNCAAILVSSYETTDVKTTTTKPTTMKNYQYIDFLEDLSKRSMVYKWKEECKLKYRKTYVRFLIDLESYLRGFLHRTVPLLNIERDVIQPENTKFNEIWSQTGGYTTGGWTTKPAEAILVSTAISNENNGTTEADNGGNNNSNNYQYTTKIDLSVYETANELSEKQNPDTIKSELGRLGLKCGGTPLQRAERIFLLKTKSLGELPPKLFIDKSKIPVLSAAPESNSATQDGSEGQPVSSSGTTPTVISTKKERRIDIARRECIINALIDQVRPTIEATIRRMVRRQTQTLGEREREIEEDLYGVANATNTSTTTKRKDGDDGDDDDDEEDVPIYNPKNVPLDFDGRPIPYWLFKLHGLNHYYKCEICNGEMYRGRRAFELHFAEQKHALGMKSLGIPNTKHFHGVTKIEDVQILWNQLQQQVLEINPSTISTTTSVSALEEEYEDSHGNVISRATYEELARQGLL